MPLGYGQNGHKYQPGEPASLIVIGPRKRRSRLKLISSSLRSIHLARSSPEQWPRHFISVLPLLTHTTRPNKLARAIKQRIYLSMDLLLPFLKPSGFAGIKRVDGRATGSRAYVFHELVLIVAGGVVAEKHKLLPGEYRRVVVLGKSRRQFHLEKSPTCEWRYPSKFRMLIELAIAPPVFPPTRGGAVGRAQVCNIAR